MYRTVSSSGNRVEDLSRVADPDQHPFGKPDPDQHQSEKLGPDPHQILKQDPDPEPHQNQNYGAVGAKNGAMEGRRRSQWRGGIEALIRAVESFKGAQA